MLALKAYRCHTKHLKRLEWKWPINNTNTTSNLLEKKKKKKTPTADATHNIRFMKTILRVMETAAHS